MYRLHGEIAFDTAAHRNTARTAIIQRWGTDNTLSQTYATNSVDGFSRPQLECGAHFTVIDSGLALRQWLLDQITEHPVAKAWVEAAWITLHRTDQAAGINAEILEYRKKGPFCD